jgi:flagellin-like protein
MKIAGKKLSKKAVSPVIATLLMVAIAVAASILVYVWAMGLIGALEGQGGQQTKQQLIMVAYKAAATAGPWELHVRNVGNSKMTIASAYVNGTLTTLTGDVTYGLIFPPGAAGTITLGGLPGGLIPGTAYTIKVATLDGAIFTYSVIAGRNE